MLPMGYGIVQVVGIAAQHLAVIRNAASGVLTYFFLEIMRISQRSMAPSGLDSQLLIPHLFNLQLAKPQLRHLQWRLHYRSHQQHWRDKQARRVLHPHQYPQNPPEAEILH